MNLNTWQEAIAWASLTVELLVLGMTLMGPQETTVVYKYTILWGLGLLNQDTPFSFSPSFLFAPWLLPGDPEMSPEWM